VHSRELGAARCSLDGVAEGTELIDQPQTVCIRARPHPSLGDGIDLLVGLVAAAGHAREELVVAAADLRLQQRTRLLAQRTIDAQLPRERRRADAVDADADLAEGPVDGRNDGEDADRAGESRRARPDLVRGAEM